MAAQKQNKLMPSHLIAKAKHIPDRFLLKVLKSLVSARILDSLKGPNGGYRLARTPNDISILDIIEAVDGPIRGHAPMSQTPNDGQLDRRLEAICNQSADQLRKHLGKVRISELAGKK
jgi:Rrf2 family protein